MRRQGFAYGNGVLAPRTPMTSCGCQGSVSNPAPTLPDRIPNPANAKSPCPVNPDDHPADTGDGSILPNHLLFGETLRRLGLDSGSADMLDLIRATEYIPIGGSRSDFHLAARALQVRRQPDLALFDEAFRVFRCGPAHGRSMRDLH